VLIVERYYVLFDYAAAEVIQYNRTCLKLGIQ